MRSLLLLIIGSVFWASPAYAAQQESVHVRAGSMFEILVDNTDPTVKTSWVLTENSEFIQAERGGIFQTRQTKD